MEYTTMVKDETRLRMYDTSVSNALRRDLERSKRERNKMSQAELDALLRQAQQGDKQSADRFVQLNLGLVGSRVLARAKCKIEDSDLFQEGIMALMESLDGYEWDKGAFSTYAVSKIDGAIKDYVSRESRQIRIPEQLTKAYTKIKRVCERHQVMYGVEATLKELLEYPELSEMSTKDITNVFKLLRGGEESLDAAAFRDEEQAYLEASEALGVSHSDEGIQKEDMLAYMEQRLYGLCDEERNVYIMKEGLDGYVLSIGEVFHGRRGWSNEDIRGKLGKKYTDHMINQYYKQAKQHLRK